MKETKETLETNLKKLKKYLIKPRADELCDPFQAGFYSGSKQATKIAFKIIKEMRANPDLMQLSDEDLLDEISFRNGLSIYCPFYITLDDLKENYLSCDDNYKEGDEKDFCQYLSKYDIGNEQSSDAIFQATTDFYKIMNNNN